MPRMTGGEALAKQLHREGVRVVFGLPGVQLYGAMAALRDEKDIRFILTRHEQATTYMADGYARAGGGFGVALVTLEEEGEAELVPAVKVERAAAPDADIERAARLLLSATRPIIYAGGGVHASGAHEALTAVAEYVQAGVVQSAEGKGAVSDHNDLSLGATLWPKNALREYLDAADVVFAVGSRCAVAGFQPAQKIIQLDVDASEIGRNHPVEVGLVGDAKATLERLLERLRTDAPPRSSRKRE